jgi:hypothetical protein
VRETDPFTDRPAVALSFRETSPYVNRIRILWQKMRDPVIESFPEAPGLPRNSAAYMKCVEEPCVTDAYHSLSIDGYRVTPELIRRIRSGTWNPDANELDLEQRDVMAARGYWQALQFVQKSIAKVLKGENPGAVVDDDHRGWYREIRAQRDGGPTETLRPRRLSKWAGSHPEVYARAVEPGCGPGCDARLLRSPTRGRAPSGACCARAFCIRINPSVHGRLGAWALPYECHDGRGRLPIDGHTALRAQHLYGRS